MREITRPSQAWPGNHGPISPSPGYWRQAVPMTHRHDYSMQPQNTPMKCVRKRNVPRASASLAISLLLTRPTPLAEDGDEHVALPGGVRREEFSHLVIQRGGADRAETERVRPQVELAGGE